MRSYRWHNKKDMRERYETRTVPHAYVKTGWQILTVRADRFHAAFPLNTKYEKKNL